MGVDKSGENCFAGHVQTIGLGPGQFQDFLILAHRFPVTSPVKCRKASASDWRLVKMCNLSPTPITGSNMYRLFSAWRNPRL